MRAKRVVPQATLLSLSRANWNKRRFERWVFGCINMQVFNFSRSGLFVPICCSFLRFLTIWRFKIANPIILCLSIVKIGPEKQKDVKYLCFFIHAYCNFRNPLYICCVFFMVLDLRLIKIGCRETINFFLPYCFGQKFLPLFCHLKRDDFFSGKN